MRAELDVDPAAPAPPLLTTNLVHAQVPHPFLTAVNLPLGVSVMGPAEAAEPLPLLVWIEGGGWFFTDKDLSIPALAPYAAAGFVVASVGYRTSGAAHFPAQLEDVKTGLRFLRAHAERFAIDVDRVAVMGQSAGGHLAALVGLTAGRPEFETPDWAGQRSDVAAVVDWFGPSDLARLGDPPTMFAPNDPFSPDSRLLGAVAAEAPERVAAASPVSYVHAGAPPFLILHGDADELVPFAQSELLHDALEAAGVDVTLLKLRGAGHGGGSFHVEAVRAAVLAFLHRHLRAGV